MNPITERPLQYPWFLKKNWLQGSAFEGTIRTRDGDRVVVLPEELLQGLHRAIAFETGAALPIIAYTCGRRWGARMVRRWDAQWREHYQERMEQTEFDMFQAWLIQSFRFQGWGELSWDFSMEQQGVLHFEVRNCVLSRLLADLEEPMVADIFAGVFAALSSWVVGRELECAQIACEKSGAPACRFVVATPERIEKVRNARLEGATTEQMMSRLMEE
jgi:predicted hydrocarbon binding protein